MKKIDCLSLGTMCEVLLDGEPVFILRAQGRRGAREMPVQTLQGE